MADQLLTAAMVHLLALGGFAAGIATLWAISRALPNRIRALAAPPAQAVDLGHLQRVDPEIHHDANGAYGEMTPNDDGEWVRFSDVESLLIGRKGGR